MSPKQRFLSLVSVAELRAIRDEVLRRYPEASAFYERNLGKLGRRRRVLGAMRSGLFEDALLGVCEANAELYAVPESNRKRSWGYALVEGPGLVFSGTTLRSANMKPRSAEYRRNLGLQGHLMGPQPSQRPLDALLIHVPPRGAEAKPAALLVRFLDGDGGYLPETIDLLRLEEAAVVRTVVHLPRVRRENVPRTTRIVVKRRSEPKRID